jgi:DnaJ-class molecular chaperone
MMKHIYTDTKGNPLPKKEPQPNDRTPSWNLVAECAECEGHGKWFEPKYANILIHCSNCNGWGYVTPEQGTHIHVWKEMPAPMFTLKRVCECGAEQNIDTSG